LGVWGDVAYRPRAIRNNGIAVGDMLVLFVLCAAVLAIVTSNLPSSSFLFSQAAREIQVRRLPENPLVKVDTSPMLGGNVNGPTVIRVPNWIDRPLGRYYMYFANHMGDSIRLAYSDAVSGPWKIYAPGAVHVRETAFFRAQPDPPETLDDFYTHVASPEVFIDSEKRRLVLWFHGWWTNGERWPREPREARTWARSRGYGQYTQVAVSGDGIHFDLQSAITKQSYLRIFRHGGYFYSMARLGQLLRSSDPLAAFETGPNPFRDTAYADRVRHVALARRGARLHVFFTAIGDAPERVLASTIDLTPDWQTWRASPPVPVLQPETSYECASLPMVPSEPGDVQGRVRQIRDPFVLEDQDRTFSSIPSVASRESPLPRSPCARAVLRPTEQRLYRWRL
jgi:hypothetical protein